MSPDTQYSAPISTELPSPACLATQISPHCQRSTETRSPDRPLRSRAFKIDKINLMPAPRSAQLIVTRPFPAPALDELCVFPPYAEAWGAVAALVRRRRADGHPLRRLCVLCERDTRDAALRRAFEGWKADVAALDGAVEEVVFETVPRYRRGDVPEAFRTFIGR